MTALQYWAVRALIIIFASVPFAEAAAQGCSDAGFCSLGNLRTQKNDSLNVNKQKLGLFLPYGAGDDGVHVITPGIEYFNQLTTQWAIQAKLTANYATGSLGTAWGFGDLFISTTSTLKSKSNWVTSIMIAAKFPLRKSDLSTDGQPLPMQYQSSLGTVDAITGLTVHNAHWQFSAGWQQPLTGGNTNSFLPAYWNTPDAQHYPPSKKLTRRGDILLKSTYTVIPVKKFSLNAGLLGVYHLGEDQYTDQNNSTLSIQGSGGLTLNATLACWWQFSDSLVVGFTAGSPLIVREVRPDGLTRSFTLAPEIILKF